MMVSLHSLRRCKINIHHCSTPELLSVLVGRRIASKLSKVPLSVLFEIRTNRQLVSESLTPYAADPIISAAKKLIARARAEEISINPISFSNPDTVKNYLRLALGGRQQKITRMTLLADKGNPAALEFYGKLGFCPSNMLVLRKSPL